MTQIDTFGSHYFGRHTFGRHYLRLALEINKHIEGYVDAYLGPPDLRAEVEAAAKRPAALLLDDLEQLRQQLPEGDEERRSYLVATLRAIDCSVRIIHGAQFDYLDEVHRLYDIRPQQVDETVFTAAHQELDTLLPGDGTVAERIEARRRRYELNAEQVLPLLELARAETRQRTQEIVPLVAGEDVEFRLTANQPWSAYNWYLGHGRSLIEFNTDIPVSALGMLATCAHEAYPGHHTEHQLKERHLYQEKGYAEQAVFLLHSPAAVIAEGIATTAAEIIFPAGGEHEWNETVLLPAAGLPVEPAEQMRRIARASRLLRYVSGNAAILYHSGQISERQAIDYIQTYGLAGEQRARQSFRFLSNPLFRSYIFTYTEGYDLIRQASQNGNKTAVFLRLLTGQVLPSGTQQWTTPPQNS
jgi:hypothetical protein